MGFRACKLWSSIEFFFLGGGGGWVGVSPACRIHFDIAIQGVLICATVSVNLRG